MDISETYASICLSLIKFISPLSLLGSTSQLRCGCRQSLTASPPDGSTHKAPDDCSTSSSMSQEHLPCYPASEPEEGPSVAIQEVLSAPEHESQGRPSSSLAATTISSVRKGNSKSLHSTNERRMSLVASGLCLNELVSLLWRSCNSLTASIVIHKLVHSQV